MIPTQFYDGGLIWEGLACPLQRGYTVDFGDGNIYIVEKSPEYLLMKETHENESVSHKWIQKVCLIPTFTKEGEGNE